MIYFLVTADNLYVKIGHTTERGILARLRCYRLHSPYELTIAGCMPGTLFDEAELQGKFQAFRLRGEWYHYTDEIRQFIEANKEINTPYAQPSIIYKHSPQLVEEIKKLYLNGMPVKELCKKYNKTTKAIRGILYRNKINRKS